MAAACYIEQNLARAEIVNELKTIRVQAGRLKGAKDEIQTEELQRHPGTKLAKIPGIPAIIVVYKGAIEVKGKKTRQKIGSYIESLSTFP